MGRPIDEIMNQLPEERRNRIIAESERLEVEYQIRQILCKAEKLTQSQWAEILSTQQAAVSNMEKRSDLTQFTFRSCVEAYDTNSDDAAVYDLMLFILRGYVEAIGGKLNFTVEFPDHGTVGREGLGDTERPPSLR